VTHRAERITADGIITKGDENYTNDPDPVTKDNYIGKTVFAIPHLGAVLGFFRTMGGMIVLGITGVLIIVSGLFYKQK
jgi:signal peptidase